MILKAGLPARKKRWQRGLSLLKNRTGHSQQRAELIFGKLKKVRPAIMSPSSVAKRRRNKLRFKAILSLATLLKASPWLNPWNRRRSITARTILNLPKTIYWWVSGSLKHKRPPCWWLISTTAWFYMAKTVSLPQNGGHGPRRNDKTYVPQRQSGYYCIWQRCTAHSTQRTFPIFRLAPIIPTRWPALSWPCPSFKKKASNKQVFMITDGKPSCLKENGESIIWTASASTGASWTSASPRPQPAGEAK